MVKISPMLVLLFFVGCQSNVNQIEYVLPNGFQGTVIIREEGDAPVVPKVDGRYVVNIPEGGVFIYSGYNPWQSYLSTARFANGDPIWVYSRFGDKPNKGQIGLFGGYSTREWSTTKGYGVPEFRIFIGTEEQWKNRDRNDEVPKKPDS